MIKVVGFHPDHLERISLKKIHDGEKPEKIGSKALTLLREGRPIAIFGAIFLGTHVMHIWGLLSEEIRKVPLEFVGVCQELLLWCQEKYQVKRFQIDVRVDYPEGQRFAKFLGFAEEGVMRSFCPDGADCYLFGRVV